MKRRIMSMLFALVFAAALFAGCGQSPSSGGGPPRRAPTAAGNPACRARCCGWAPWPRPWACR